MIRTRTVLTLAVALVAVTPLAAPAQAAPAAAPKTIVARGNSAAFVSPSGNITCVMSREGAAGFVRCEAGSRSWRLPRKPASCELDWGQGLTLDRRARLLCAGDTVAGAASLSTTNRTRTAWFRSGRDVAVRSQVVAGRAAGLRYGYRLKLGNVSCTSTVKGVTCVDSSTRHGFSMSRAAYRTW